jgi:hypothetical protein
LSTSIKPNTRVRPEAMIKMIMPMARPATVSVTQVEGEPIKGSTSSASANTSASGPVESRVFMRGPCCAASGHTHKPHRHAAPAYRKTLLI